MSIKTHDGTNNNGLFDVLGVAFYALGQLNTARGTTVATAAAAILSQFDKVPATTLNADAVSGLGDALTGWQQSGSGLASTIQTACQNVLTAFVQADTNTVPPGNLTANLTYLITQMAANGTTGGSYVSAKHARLQRHPRPRRQRRRPGHRHGHHAGQWPDLPERAGRDDGI